MLLQTEVEPFCRRPIALPSPTDCRRLGEVRHGIVMLWWLSAWNCPEAAADESGSARLSKNFRDEWVAGK